jgi:hypothetical protein
VLYLAKILVFARLGPGNGGNCCGEGVILAAAALIALGVALAIGILTLTVCLGVPVPPWLWIVAGIVAAAGLLIVLICYILCVLPFVNCRCPTSCDWLLISWYSSLVGVIVAIYLKGCCDAFWWAVAIGLTLAWIATFQQWVRNCSQTSCKIYLTLIGALAIASGTIIGYIALIPAIAACGWAAIPATVGTIIAVLTALAIAACRE